MMSSKNKLEKDGEWVSTLKFYDTNALLRLLDNAFKEPFIISSKTLEEIENIKVDQRKDPDIKYRARLLAHLLDDNSNGYDVVIPNDEIYNILKCHRLSDSPDNIIIACAFKTNNVQPIEFISDDINCKTIARKIFKLNVSGVQKDNSDDYKGYLEFDINDNELSYFYENIQENIYNLLDNQYLVLNYNGTSLAFRWDGTMYRDVYAKPIKSLSFGSDIKPKDAYQQIAIDSILHNDVTVISGKAGSGKSLIALMTAMYLIDSHKFDRLVVAFNPTKTRGACDLGFYSGSFHDKAMQNSIGHILSSKFGDSFEVARMIDEEKIKLISMADIRGYEVKENEILYMTESQNTSIDLLKLCLSRAATGCKVIVEGDYNSQVDSFAYDGLNNGMKRAIEVLKGESIFGYVELKNVWRSKLAELVDKM